VVLLDFEDRLLFLEFSLDPIRSLQLNFRGGLVDESLVIFFLDFDLDCESLRKSA
jgi:hypothetical protein